MKDTILGALAALAAVLLVFTTILLVHLLAGTLLDYVLNAFGGPGTSPGVMPCTAVAALVSLVLSMGLGRKS